MEATSPLCSGAFQGVEENINEVYGDTLFRINGRNKGDTVRSDIYYLRPLPKRLLPPELDARAPTQLNDVEGWENYRQMSFTTYLEEDPHYLLKVETGLALVYQYNGRYENAITTFNAILDSIARIESEQDRRLFLAETHFLLALLHRKRSDYTQAIMHCEQALENRHHEEAIDINGNQGIARLLEKLRNESEQHQQKMQRREEKMRQREEKREAERQREAEQQADFERLRQQDQERQAMMEREIARIEQEHETRWQEEKAQFHQQITGQVQALERTMKDKIDTQQEGINNLIAENQVLKNNINGLGGNITRQTQRTDVIKTTLSGIHPGACNILEWNAIRAAMGRI